MFIAKLPFVNFFPKQVVSVVFEKEEKMGYLMPGRGGWFGVFRDYCIVGL